MLKGVRFLRYLRNNSTMSKRLSTLKIALIVATTAMIGVAQAQSSEWTRALQPELELTSHLSERLDIRFGITGDQLNTEADRGPIFSLGDETMQFSALVDYSLHSSGLRMTGGAVYDESWLSDDSIAMPSLSSEDMRTYVGVGWDNDLGSNGRFGLSLDMGLTFEGIDDSVSLDGSGTESSSNALFGSTFDSWLYTPSFSAGVEVRF